MDHLFPKRCCRTFRRVSSVCLNPRAFLLPRLASLNFLLVSAVGLCPKHPPPPLVKLYPLLRLVESSCAMNACSQKSSSFFVSIPSLRTRRSKTSGPYLWI